MRKISIGLAVGVAIIAPPAQAGMKLTYVLPDKNSSPYARRSTVTITDYIDDAGNYRRERTVNGKASIEMIGRDGVLYAVRDIPGSVGRLAVMRQSDIEIAESEAYAKAWQGNPPTRAHMITELVDLGPEKVAGYRGEHYLIKTWFDDSRQPDRDVVFSTDRRLALAVRGEALMKDWAPSDKLRNKQYYAAISSGITLRDGDQIILDRVEVGSIDPIKFELPGPVMVLDDVRKLFPASSFVAPLAPPTPAKR